jgi:hypothetical protein
MFPFATSAPRDWKTDCIIAMIVVGLVVLVVFGVYETYCTPKHFLKNKFLLDRTVIGSCLINAIYQVVYCCWNSYFTSFFKVMCNLSVSEAGYVNSTFRVVSGVLLFILGFLIRRTSRFKWLFYIAVPLYRFGLS